ncbi:MAG: polysulfide reductase NrfD [Gemmatimonadaceae bacterium]|nr:polysulfide reductase NrfD [Gemmatimonadaceae bacterium]
MQTNLPSTFFTAPPEFGWIIILYFFIGGIGGGSLLLAGLLRLFGIPADRPYIRLASFLAVVCAGISAVLLIADLSSPLRFWHMVIQDHTLLPMFKWWSAMSDGVWILLAFSLFAGTATIDALQDIEWPPMRTLRSLLRVVRFISRPPFATISAIGGIVSGLSLAGYTGVLLAETNRPIWSDSSWLGIVFLMSALSTSMAAVMLLSHWRRVHETSTLEWLTRFDLVAMVLELVAIVCFVISLGNAAQALYNVWGVALVLGVMVVGIVVPLVLQRRSNHGIVLPASLVLAGGLLLRAVVLLGSERIHVVGTQVVR